MWQACNYASACFHRLSAAPFMFVAEQLYYWLPYFLSSHRRAWRYLWNRASNYGRSECSLCVLDSFIEHTDCININWININCINIDCINNDRINIDALILTALILTALILAALILTALIFAHYPGTNSMHDNPTSQTADGLHSSPSDLTI